MKVLNRIKKSDEFLLTIKKGKAYRSDAYTIHISNNQLSYTRVGISVSSKLGNAVTRNRIKRQVRSMCDSILNYDNQSLDIVIIVRKPFLDGVFSDNKSQLSDLLTSQVGNKQ